MQAHAVKVLRHVEDVRRHSQHTAHGLLIGDAQIDWDVVEGTQDSVIRL